MAEFQSNADAAVTTWTVLDIANTTGTTDPNSIANGAVTMSGDFLQIPVAASTSQQVIPDGYVLHFASPPGLLDGSNTYLAVRVTIATLPTGAYGVHVGTWDDAVGQGLVAGFRHVVSTGKTRPRMSVHGGFVEGTDATATALTAVGLLNTVGSYDGVDLILQSGSVVMEENGAVYGTSQANSGGGLPTTAGMDLVIFISYTNNVLATETLDVKCEYAVIPYPV